jgi:hypothetical protein
MALLKFKRSAVSGKAPALGDLELGELAINTFDGKVYMRKDNGTASIIEVGGGTGTVTSVAASGGTTGLTFTGSPITSSGTITLAGTLNVANGGTGATSLTSGYVLKGNGTSAVSAGVIYDDGTNIGIGTSSPSSKLHIANSTAADTFFRSSNSLTTSQFGTEGSGATRLLNDSANPMIFYTNAAERMRIDSSGNVGIGTSSPAVKLDVGGDILTSTNTFFSSNLYYSGGWKYRGNGYGGLIKPAGTDGSFTFLMAGNNTSGAGAAATATEYMRVASGGNVAVGNSNAAPKFSVTTGGAFTWGSAWDGNVVVFGGNGAGSGAGSGGLGIAYDDTNGCIMGPGTPGVAWRPLKFYSDYLSFSTNGSTERMRIDTSGNVLVGTTQVNPALSSTRGCSINLGYANFCRNGPVIYATNLSTGGLLEFRANGSSLVGSISVTGSATAYNTSSDARLKHDIVDAPEASSLIDAINVRSFKWNADDSEQAYGMIAQELLEVVPEVVYVPEDEEMMMGVDYSKLVPMLIKEIQSLRARVAQLEGK